MTNAIETEGLVKTYPGGVRALDGLTLKVSAGGVFALLGPNGAGKSTTVKILTTLSRPDQGRATVAGIDVLRRPGDVRQAIGVVGQKPGFDLEATGRENLRLQGRLYGLGGLTLERRIDELFDRLRLADAADRLARMYSGGMQRRLDIAMGLIHVPRVLFLDEPTTGLDPEVRAEMWRELAALAAENELTILLTTHYLEEADTLAGRLAILDRGRIVAEGSPEELKRELRGDALRVELTGAVNGAGDALERLPDLRDVAIDGNVLLARADDGGRAVPAVLSTLESHGIGVASVTVARPSLDDVYLRHAGRSFEAAERGPSNHDHEEMAR